MTLHKNNLCRILYNEIQHIAEHCYAESVMLSVIYAESRIQTHHPECHCANIKNRYAKCRFPECHAVIYFGINILGS